MVEEAQRLPENTVSPNEFSMEEARVYRTTGCEDKPFLRRYRMRRLEQFEERFAQELFRLVGSDAHIVDVPCGNGRFFEIFSKAKSLSMVDYSVNMLKAVEERFGTRDNLRLIQAEISCMPLTDSSADLCFCMRLFHHMKDDKVRLAALKELTRISKKYVALSFYNKRCVRYYWRKALRKKIRGNYVTLAHIAELAKQVGLELIARFPRRNVFEQQSLVVFRKRDEG